MSDMPEHGRFCWNELMTTDPAAARAFYGTLFGWTYEDGMSDEPYSILSVGKTEQGGIMPMPPEAAQMPPNWGAYVAVDDVDASARQAEELGGKILLEPRDIPHVGRFCVISDPQGAVLSMITLSHAH